jgi:hypothetical protein
MKKKCILSFLLIGFTINFSILTNAQIREFGNFIVTGTDDAQKLFKEHITPYANGFGASLTGGWYNTAKPHSLGGFDVTLSLNAAFVPSEHKKYVVDDLELNSLQRLPGTETESPTIAGENASGPEMQYTITQNGLSFSDTAFALPPGTGVGIVPSPMIQAGIGLIKGTEVMVRYMPKVGNDKGKLGLWGVGLKHDIKQWIPVLSSVPILNISVMGGYTKLNTYIELAEINPGEVNLEDYYQGTDPSVWEDQRMVFTAGSFTGNLLVSADLPVVCFYGGVGFARTATNLKLEGNYPMITDFTVDGNELTPVVTAEEDPLDIEIKNQDGGLTKPRVNIGMRIKLGILTLHADYTRANYNVISAGLGISFR